MTTDLQLAVAAAVGHVPSGMVCRPPQSQPPGRSGSPFSLTGDDDAGIIPELVP